LDSTRSSGSRCRSNSPPAISRSRRPCATSRRPSRPRS
jgi:hypothetical protein